MSRPGAMSTSRMFATARFPGRSNFGLVGIPALAPQLRGRETETGVMREALDRVARGGQVIVLVEGEAGIGKTRLLEQAPADAAARGMQGAAVHLPADRPDSPGARVRQARHLLPGPARRPGR
jgi:hypothetical protein